MIQLSCRNPFILLMKDKETRGKGYYVYIWHWPHNSTQFRRQSTAVNFSDQECGYFIIYKDLQLFSNNVSSPVVTIQ